jgi:hypothetical protein
MRFVWFWTFWHWSKESFREGSLLRGPLHGIGSHWDEWYRHEASENDREAIKNTGRTESTQRQFIAWLFLHWAREANWPGNRLTPRFVVGQLAQLPPFNQWPAFKEYRTSYGLGGVSAVVLAEGSLGEPGDVRQLEAIALPDELGGTAPKVVPEGFHADSPQLDIPRRAAISLLSGKGLLIFLALWVAGGRRPYPRWLSTVLALGWMGVIGLIIYLLVGPDPDERLFWFVSMLVTLWLGLVSIGFAVVVSQCFRAWRAGKNWSTRLEQSELRLRMPGGLTLKGSSAGLPICLNALLSVYRVNPPAARPSWLWHRFFRKLHCGAEAWAATGTVMPNAVLQPVVLEPKIRACLQQDGIRHILTPRQRDGRRRVINRVADALTSIRRQNVLATPVLTTGQLGFAAEKPSLRSHPCRHVSQAIMAIGDLSSRWQMAVNAFALFVSAIMVIALPDLRSILLPYTAPTAVPPASLSPYYLWVSLDTKHPEYFQVVLESGFWSNRRADVKQYGGVTPSVRAEIHLHRLTRMTVENEWHGDVWLERRRRFLNREFAPGERVGRFSIPYLYRIGHE